jgi:D-lactate dehydrogenase (cytochrome)
VRWPTSTEVPVIPYGVGSSLEGHLLAVQGGVTPGPVAHEPGAVGQRRGPDRDRSGRRHPRAAQPRDPRSTGLFFPIDPGANATIGGMCAPVPAGTNAVRYGTMRENVLALTVVTASGEVIRTGTARRRALPATT